jgi:hypothetical protein
MEYEEMYLSEFDSMRANMTELDWAMLPEGADRWSEKEWYYYSTFGEVPVAVTEEDYDH